MRFLSAESHPCHRLAIYGEALNQTTVSGAPQSSYHVTRPSGFAQKLWRGRRSATQKVCLYPFHCWRDLQFHGQSIKCSEGFRRLCGSEFIWIIVEIFVELSKIYHGNTKQKHGYLCLCAIPDCMASPFSNVII